MAQEDVKKTTFVIPWGTFCYKVMLFGLKYVEATYQRALVTLFRDMMHKEIEVYVGDKVAKSGKEENHIEEIVWKDIRFEIWEVVRICGEWQGDKIGS